MVFHSAKHDVHDCTLIYMNMYVYMYTCTLHCTSLLLKYFSSFLNRTNHRVRHVWEGGKEEDEKSKEMKNDTITCTCMYMYIHVAVLPWYSSVVERSV